MDDLRPTMPDDLRTRIANAIWEELRTQNNLVNFDRLADAVIAELGLKSQWINDDGIISDGPPPNWVLPCDIRYTTKPNENQSSLCFDLRVRIAALAQNHVRCDDCTFAKTPQQRYLHFADAVIRELNIPDRTHVDDQGRTWEWCGGQPGTWAWRITQNAPVDVDVKCAICHRTYSVRADAPGWSSLWTCCLSCQANEENEWTADD